MPDDGCTLEDAASTSSCAEMTVNCDDEAAVGDGNAAGRSRSHRAGDPWHAFDRHAGGAAGEHLFAPASEDERVAALEPHDAVALQGSLDDHVVDLILGERVRVGALARFDHLDVASSDPAVARGASRSTTTTSAALSS